MSELIECDSIQGQVIKTALPINRRAALKLFDQSQEIKTHKTR